MGGLDITEFDNNKSDLLFVTPVGKPNSMLYT
jgi:hypothetical protein